MLESHCVTSPIVKFLIEKFINIPQSTVSGIITKWKRSGTTAARPLSHRPCKITEWCERCEATGAQRWVAADLQSSRGLQTSSRTGHGELCGNRVSKAEQLHLSLTSLGAMHNTGCSDVKLHSACSLE